MIVDLLSQKETRRTAHKTMQDYDTINQTLTELQPASPQALTELQPASPQALTEPQPASPQATPMSNSTQAQTMKRSLFEKVDKPLCPVCNKKFSRKSVLKLHIQNSHPQVSQAQLQDIMNVTKVVTEKCLHCKRDFGYIYKHLLHCKVKKATDERKLKQQLEKQMMKRA